METLTSVLVKMVNNTHVCRFDVQDAMRAAEDLENKTADPVYTIAADLLMIAHRTGTQNTTQARMLAGNCLAMMNS